MRNDGTTIEIPVSIITDCDVKPCYNSSPETGKCIFNEKEVESKQAEREKNTNFTFGSVRGFASPRWTLEYCIAMSDIAGEFHKAVHYGKKILYAKDYIALTDEKINEANKDFESKEKEWKDLSKGEKAYKIYGLMLNKDGNSKLKAIVAQCLAAILRWEISVIPAELTQKNMFDIDLYGLKIDEDKKSVLKLKLEQDEFLGYIVKAIKHSVGVN